MSATEELRRLLDERGVEHVDGIIMTYTDDADYMPSASNTFDVTLYNLTPEQAIDATLGRWTCRNVGYYIDETRFKCSACGYNGWTKCAADGNDRVPNYCPNCGRKVVDA